MGTGVSDFVASLMMYCIDAPQRIVTNVTCTRLLYPFLYSMAGAFCTETVYVLVYDFLYVYASSAVLCFHILVTDS